MAEVHFMTQDGLDKLKKELADALAKRPVISAAIAEARGRVICQRMPSMMRQERHSRCLK